MVSGLPRPPDPAPRMTPAASPAPIASPAPLVSPLRWWVCVLLMLATVVNYMDRMALTQMGKRIKSSLSLDNTQYSLIESVFSATFAVGAVLTGVIVDRVSVRWVYPVMVLGWSAAGVLTGFATGFWMLLTCRCMLGFFESGNWPCGIRTTRAVLRPEERSFGNSLFQSGTALGAVITPLVVLALLQWAEAGLPPGETDPNAWKLPFRVIGSLGVVWAVLWFITVPGRMVRLPTESGPHHDPRAARFSTVFRDRRFWVLFASVVAINITWHGYRTWLPLYLQDQRGYTEAQMSVFTTFYYLIADVGSWTVGLVTLLLCRRGMGVHTARVLAFGACAGLTLSTLSVPFLPDGWQLQAGLLAVAFGALGLFPTYFALSQELSARHQGKVSGTLGAGAHFSLALIYPIEGWVIDRTGSYEPVLAAIGVAPLVALVLMLRLWPPGPAAEDPPPALGAPGGDS